MDKEWKMKMLKKMKRKFQKLGEKERNETITEIENLN